MAGQKHRACASGCRGPEVPIVRARLHNAAHAALQRDLGEDVVAHGVGPVQVDLVVRHHPDELKDLLPAGDEAWGPR